MRLLTLITICSMCLTTSSARADAVPDALRTELNLLATDIAKIIEKKGGGTIAIGEFTGSVDVIGHSGPGIQLVLADELQKAGLTVGNKNYNFEITGRYQPFHDTPESRKGANADPKDATGLNAVKLVAFLIDRLSGEPLVERPTGRLIFGAETVPEMLGLSVSIPPLRDIREQSDNIGKALHEPQVDVRGTKIAGKTGQFAIEILLKQGTGYVARPVKLHDGKPYVPLRNSDIYGVRLSNNSNHEAAADLRIDGVNCFAFSSIKSTYWIIKPHESVDVIGWHKSAEDSVEFKVVGNFPDTAAAKLNLKPSSSIGLK